MRSFLISVIIFLGSSSFANVDLGKELQLSKDPQNGNYQLGVNYSYDSGIMGDKFQINWGILFGTTISQQELSAIPSQLKWNVYSLTTKTFIAKWETQPTISGKDLFLGSVTAQDELAKYIIGGQANVILVFGDTTGHPLYNLNIGNLCRTLPTYFNNLTDSNKQCDRISVKEIEQSKNQFCDEAKVELLEYVKDGTISCEKANQMFQEKTCGSLQCR